MTQLTKILKISLIALAMSATAAYAEIDTSANADNSGSEYGFQDPSAYRPGHPGRPGWRPGRPGHGRRMHSCVARDFRGRSYMARGFGNVNRVAREALRTCQYNSRFPGTCRVIACR